MRWKRGLCVFGMGRLRGRMETWTARLELYLSVGRLRVGGEGGGVGWWVGKSPVDYGGDGLCSMETVHRIHQGVLQQGRPTPWLVSNRTMLLISAGLSQWHPSPLTYCFAGQLTFTYRVLCPFQIIIFWKLTGLFLLVVLSIWRGMRRECGNIVGNFLEFANVSGRMSPYNGGW